MRKDAFSSIETYQFKTFTNTCLSYLHRIKTKGMQILQLSGQLLYERCLSYARLTCDEDVLFSAHILIYSNFLFEGKFISNEDA
jgi:hypothetical protein